MTRTKLASVCFVAAHNCMRQQVLDHTGSPPSCGTSQSATTCESSYVLQSTTPVLLCTTKCYSSTSLHYKVYYSSTTKYYSSTTLYYKVLLQYKSVLQSTTPVLLCTTKYYTSPSLYYKVLLQYYSVLQSATPILV